jgi:hypothetical protein
MLSLYEKVGGVTMGRGDQLAVLLVTSLLLLPATTNVGSSNDGDVGGSVCMASAGNAPLISWHSKGAEANPGLMEVSAVSFGCGSSPTWPSIGLREELKKVV